MGSFAKSAMNVTLARDATRMIIAHGDTKRVVARDGAGQTLARDHAATQAQMHRAVLHTTYQLVGKQLHHGERRVRQRRDRRLEQRVDVAVANRGGMADDELIPLRSGRGPGVLRDSSRRGEQGAALVEQGLSRRRQRDPTAGAHKQRRTDLLFQLLDRTTERLLAEVQLRRRPSETGGFDDGDEMA